MSWQKPLPLVKSRACYNHWFYTNLCFSGFLNSLVQLWLLTLGILCHMDKSSATDSDLVDIGVYNLSNSPLDNFVLVVTDFFLVWNSGIFSHSYFEVPVSLPCQYILKVFYLDIICYSTNWVSKVIWSQQVW